MKANFGVENSSTSNRLRSRRRSKWNWSKKSILMMVDSSVSSQPRTKGNGRLKRLGTLNIRGHQISLHRETQQGSVKRPTPNTSPSIPIVILRITRKSAGRRRRRECKIHRGSWILLTVFGLCLMSKMTNSYRQRVANCVQQGAPA